MKVLCSLLMFVAMAACLWYVPDVALVGRFIILLVAWMLCLAVIHDA